jgi:hypothetical protein
MQTPFAVQDREAAHRSLAAVHNNETPPRAAHDASQKLGDTARFAAMVRTE